jgi:cytochrome c peroxidase
MKLAWPSVAAVAVLTGLAAAMVASSRQTVTFSSDERAAILAQGPWPQPQGRDPSNRVSGNTDAIALGRRLFFDTRLSIDGRQSCATCHDPAKSFSDSKARSTGRALVDRNAIALANPGLNRWFGWAGAADSLWAQSIHPIVDAKELGLTAEQLRERLASEPAFVTAYAHLFQSTITDDAPERVLVNIAKALAAFQETIVTGRTPFDEFRDALDRGDAPAMARYPLNAQRGLQIFVGKGNCNVCHFGPNFTSGEFEDVGVPHFAEKGRVDPGRHGGIATLLSSPFNLLGTYNDDPGKAEGVPTRHIEQQHRNWGEFRVPSLRNVARTGPYMHNGSLATLDDVVRHYSELDEERLHGHEGARLVRPLRLTIQERADLGAFLETLSEDTGRK